VDGSGTTGGADAIAAGQFSAWLEEMAAALRGDTDAGVPCGTCTACCTSSQFVPIGPDEVDALAHIPADLLFPAPKRPGHVLLGYDERGHCPMLVDGGCSIYDHRPRTCRTYDCRVFPAAGVVPPDGTKVAIAERAGQWRFDVDTDGERAAFDAVRAAAAYLAGHADELPEDLDPVNETGLAVLAVQLHGAFIGTDGDPGLEALRAQPR
jgi:hypothetical protein